MFAAIVPNADIAGASLDDFLTSVDDAERRPGPDFFAAIPAPRNSNSNRSYCRPTINRPHAATMFRFT
jgi:hypothetical protein